MTNFRSDIHAAIRKHVVPDRLPNVAELELATDEIIQLACRAITSPGTNSQIDLACFAVGADCYKISDHDAKNVGDRDIEIGSVDDVEIFCRVYDTERRERTWSNDALDRAVAAVAAFPRRATLRG